MPIGCDEYWYRFLLILSDEVPEMDLQVLLLRSNLQHISLFIAKDKIRVTCSVVSI